ncbi:SgcJ/EcaC family oxidoreductase [Catellatospora sp. TT07R-123]|uniref:SgcJ/EcaC family oxidoreductase n=1 Tax=Catellatospora sp. TT07R-123 TaxID=2733863 RepID=UPI001BB33157|nr:SgcJ/EcaC family oxidoreductase [Catellatospora sp. TT07R-123]
MTDETAVLAVFDRLYQAWRDNDADAFVEDYLDDATVTMPGVFHQGRRAVRDSMKAAFAGPLKGSRAVDEPQDIRIIDGSTAIVVSRAGVVPAGQAEVAAGQAKHATWVLCKRGGAWRIAAYSNTPAQL